MQTQPQTRQFKIFDFQLINMYNAFKDGKTKTLITFGEHGTDAYQLANTIAFNNFKITFQVQLHELGLDVTPE